MGMHFNVALRRLLSDKLATAINIFGLTLAGACCTVIALYLHGELTYDEHNARHAQIFRIVNEFNTSGTAETFAGTALPLGPMLKDANAEVQAYVRFLPATAGAPGSQSGLLLRHDADAYFWPKTFFADANVFQVFSHHVLRGAPDTALTEPGTVAVSQTLARRYFGDADPLGQILTTETGTPYRITLVFADLPQNAHLRYDALLSANEPFQVPADTAARRQALWGASVYTYLLMPENYDPNRYRAISEEFFRQNMAEMAASLKATWRSWLQPLTDIHYGSTVRFDEPTGNPAQLYGLAIVGVFILLIAGINYVNLATARATAQARAVGIRKILGAPRRALIAEFLSEAVLLAVLSAAIGVALSSAVLSTAPIEALLGKTLTLNPLDQPGFVVALLACSVALGLLAGAYPALYLSSWAANALLIKRNGAAKGGLRRALVLLQLTVSVAVIASTLLIGSQMRFLGTRDVGFEKENRIMVTLRGADLIDQVPAIKNELSSISGVLGVSTSANTLGQTIPVSIFKVENAQGTQQSMTVSFMGIDADFLDVMGIRLVAGRNFSKDRSDTGSTFLVNETFVRTIGWDSALDKKINDGQVVGVVEDFNFKSLHNPIEPFVLTYFPPNLNNVPKPRRLLLQRTLIVNVADQDITNTLRAVGTTIARFDPSHPFEFKFVDESLDSLYRSDRQLLDLIAIFAGICIFIACLGLFGLASFTTDQRSKEIGIRKVSGASAYQIVFLLAGTTLVLIFPATVIGSVAAHFAVDAWLANFAYRAPTNLLVFPITMMVVAAVAYSTIALQSHRVARRNPVNALRED